MKNQGAAVRPMNMASKVRSVAWLALALMAGQANASCPRPLQVPLSSTGFSVILGPQGVGGVYPDFLRAMEAKEGCQFIFTAMPRARQELLFASGRADLLIPASRTPQRDAIGTFVPLIRSRAVVISTAQQHSPFNTLQDVVTRSDVQVVLVRGFDFGTVYQKMAQTLAQQNRLLLEPDAVSVARLLKANPRYVTVMAPSILIGVLPEDPRLAGLDEQLLFEAVDDLPWGESGVYVSNTALKPSEVSEVAQILRRQAESGSVWKRFQAYYSPAALKNSIKAYEP
jgi:polar amino acid transport system substrate-binding protein